MRKSCSTLAIFAATAMAASTASGALLVPGSSSPLSGWTPAAGGSQIYTMSYSFTAIDVPQGAGTATGLVEQTIELQNSGELIFSLRISQLNADSGVTVSTMSMAGWSGFSVDADYLLGSGAASPDLVSRSASGSVVTWANFNEPVSDGKSSAIMQTLTDASGYTESAARFTIEFSDGSRALMLVAAPSTIPSPGPVALLLGAAACAVRRRR